MDLSSFLQGPGARVKEAEALAILAANALPARKMLDAAKREFGEVLPVSDLGVFISPIAEQNYKQGKKEATRLLFDGYAEIIFPHLLDAKAFIASLDEIAARVNTALGVIDRDEALLCRLAWEKMAWERAQPTWLGSAWRNLQDRLRRGIRNRGAAHGQVDVPESPETVIEPGPESIAPSPSSTAESTPDDEGARGNPALIAERARRRQAVVMPILKKRRWTRGRLVTESGVGKATVYGYLDGTRAWIDDANRKSIAEVLDLKAGELPG